MSRDHGKIKSSLWRSQKFRRLANNDRAKLQYCYFHTCPHGNSIGCYPIAMGYMMADLFWGEEQIAETIDHLVDVDLIDWNADEQIVRIVGFVGHDQPTNFKHATFMVKEALAIADCVQKLRVIKDLLLQHAVREMETKNKDGWDRLSAALDRLSLAYEGQSPLPCPCPSPLPEPSPLPKATNVALPARRAHRAKSSVPSGFPTKEDLDWAEKHWLSKDRSDLSVTEETDKFRDYHTSNATTSADWAASWRTWAKNAVNFSKRQTNGSGNRPTAHENLQAGTLIALKRLGAA